MWAVCIMATTGEEQGDEFWAKKLAEECKISLEEAKQTVKARKKFSSLVGRVRSAESYEEADKCWKELMEFLGNLKRNDPKTSYRLSREVSETLAELPPPSPPLPPELLKELESTKAPKKKRNK